MSILQQIFFFLQLSEKPLTITKIIRFSSFDFPHSNIEDYFFSSARMRNVWIDQLSGERNDNIYLFIFNVFSYNRLSPQGLQPCELHTVESTEL